jgi:hypothetical protein
MCIPDMLNVRGTWVRNALAAGALLTFALGALALRLDGRTMAATRPDTLPPRNAHRDVKYVGDRACVACHPGIAEKFRRHPMGRSLSPVTAESVEQYGPQAGNPFDAAGFQFQVERRADQIIHKVRRLDDQNQVICQAEAEVSYAVGAGTRGRSYFINRDGYLFQSPISWYADRQRWDLSPHLGAAPEQLYRPVQPLCLFCHCNQALPVQHTANHYRSPIFTGHAIGCERCHGPGQLHVASREKGEAVEPDDTIVNPRRLPTALREAVCQQCHLLGVTRVLRRDRQPFDYRPGHPLQEYWSVFVRSSENGEMAKFASHVEQMQASRCFLASQGKLGCVSCHDPHEKPVAADRTAFFRGRCLTCHTERSCALPASARRQQHRDDSCMECHMPRIKNVDLAHMSSTDHRILRKPKSTDDLRPEAKNLGGSQELMLFHKDHVANEDREVGRDRGVALMDLAGLRQPEPTRRRMAETALPLLGSSLSHAPKDVPALQAKGYGLWLLNRKPEAMAAFEAALALAPEREETLVYAAGLAAQLERHDDALAYWQRARAVNPWSTRTQHETAKLLARQADFQGAREACLAVLKVDPFQPAARMLLVRCNLRLALKEEADADFDKLLRLNPKDGASVRRWYAQELQAAGYMRK